MLLALGALMLVAMVPAAAPAGTGDGPTAVASKKCRVGNDRGYGTTYVRAIHVRNVGCKRGRRVVRAFHKCRKGRKGRCKRRVKGFKCKENRNVGLGQFDSTVKCKRGGKRVNHSYTQNT